MVWIGFVRCEKFLRDFVGRTFPLIATVRPDLHRVSRSSEIFPNARKHYETYQNMSLGFNGMDRVPLLRKIPTRLRGTNFCNSSARFAPRFITQANSPKYTQIVRKRTKTSVQGPMGWIVPSLQKILTRLRVKQYETPKKHQFRVQWCGSGAFVAKNSDATSWHELLHQFGTFCNEFHYATKWSQMRPTSTKHTKTSVQGPMGWIGCVRCEKF